MLENAGDLGDLTPSHIDSSLKKKDDLALKEILITPDYSFPENMAINSEVPQTLQSLFIDITKAIEEISKDYHEENSFKRYLQEKWKELIGCLRS